MMYFEDEDNVITHSKSIDEKLNCTVQEMLHGIEKKNVERLKQEYIKDEFGEAFVPQGKDNRPQVNHYQQGQIEPIDFINSHELNFNLGNAIKYVTRCNYKGTKRQDLQKAIDYINFELERTDD